MRKKGKKREAERAGKLNPNARKAIWGFVFLAATVIFIAARFDGAGPVGELIFKYFGQALGIGYYLLCLGLATTAGLLLFFEKHDFSRISWLGAIAFFAAALAAADIISPGSGGLAGYSSKIFTLLLGKNVGLVVSLIAATIGAVIAFNIPWRIKMPERKEVIVPDAPPKAEPLLEKSISAAASEAKTKLAETGNGESAQSEKKPAVPPKTAVKKISFKNYVPPPAGLLRSSSEKPNSGDLRANANIIRRTLEGFGIPVEMGEITIGPKVTRYTLKPAEGVKLSRITALNQDLALALAAHPLRIEAPIPGKSLVGIEVPNKAAAVVRLGSLISYPEFAASGGLSFVLGRDIAGEPIFPNIAKMPHLLVAGSTGSGKSVTIHSLIISLLYKNSPETLRLILIDPKRVELSIYGKIPHLLTPVITEGKKVISALRFAIQEMEKRYEILLNAGSRDITSYNATRKEEPMPYILIVIDELADLMAAYGREVEGSIVRLAQMARATGIHLVVSTQRPSVEVITGLIKANITSRVALQVPSQVDSRTILDCAGAEKLLGGGDMLFISSQLSKPKRIQGAYVSEEEIKEVADFIAKNNESSEQAEIRENSSFSNGAGFDDDSEDELYPEAVRVVKEADKASASLLQRRLKVGYARAARLLDIMEANGLIGRGEGAKPREVYIDQNETDE
jgi:S-DNA-T family DNA segregation ATPase FtsK/SpoIIIE